VVAEGIPSQYKLQGPPVGVVAEVEVEVEVAVAVVEMKVAETTLVRLPVIFALLSANEW